MPKRRRHRRYRKGRPRKPKGGTDDENDMESTLVEDEMRTCFDNDSFNRSKRMTPLAQGSSPRTPSPQLNVSRMLGDVSLIKTTPVNKRRSINRQERLKSSDSYNVTNLNVLFDSNFLYGSPRSDSDISANRLSPKKRSKSSIPKLHSPVKEKSLFVSQGTQTNLDIETPLVTPKAEKINNSDRKPYFYNGEVNFNPYLNNREIKVVKRDSSLGSSPFFSPNLFQHKSSSTPIEKLQRSNSVAEYIKDSLTKDNVNDPSFNIGKVDFPNDLNNSGTNLNLNLNTPVSEKVINKDDCLRSIKMHSVNVSRRRSYRTSPKTTAYLTHSKIVNRRQSFTYTRFNMTRRSSGNSSSNALTTQSQAGMCEKMLNRFKKYTKVSQKWSVKVLALCTQLGSQLKNSLSSVCNIYNDRAMLCGAEQPVCGCEEYREQIAGLNSKIEELDGEVKALRSEIEEQENSRRNIEMLNQELSKVKEELMQFTEIRAELETLKEQFKCLKSTPSPAFTLPPPPCLPPPPPPPPPPPASRSSNRGEGTSEVMDYPLTAKPLNTLALRVVFQERSGLNTPTSRRSQPLVSMEMLKQVKLRPASRASLRCETPEVQSPVLATSPHSSLRRLLNCNNDGFRLKRLRKVGGYSFDSVYRRSVLGKRERDGS
ncbi:hypothetical protein NQ318_005836 [Aromia moschata]|uniref:Uncharacterized protein n=1 Tax=Aromia moschata TaxID=1265417 RepID=A0AAV8YRR7_9CUCU|nr:hypothetical protein NQ318_005836 [Aromia moschata]